MSSRRPLVIAPDPGAPGDTSATVQQLQRGDELDIPLADRVGALEAGLRALALHLAASGLAVPEELLS